MEQKGYHGGNNDEVDDSSDDCLFVLRPKALKTIFTLIRSDFFIVHENIIDGNMFVCLHIM